MAPQTPSKLTRRHGNATNGSHSESQNGSSSSTPNNKFHYASSSALNATSTRVLAAIAAFSFLVGIASTYTDSGNQRMLQQQPIEAGFEPPHIRQQKPRQVGMDMTRQSAGGRGAPSSFHSHNHNQHNKQRPTPRIIAVQISPHSHALTYQIPSPSIQHTAPPSIPTDGLHPIHPSWYESNAAYFMDGVDFDKCQPMAEWQLSSYVDCNKFHELDLRKLRMINRGGSRIAFELTQSLPNNSNSNNNTIYKFVYKTMRYGKDIDTYQIEQQRKDSLVMERTTSSQFIPNIHGYCSLAVMMDYMPEGNMHDYIKGSRIMSRKLYGRHGVEDTEGKLLSSQDRLRVGIHIATSVADLHGIDGTRQPSYFHNDLCCHQYLFQDGVFKLNDFNYARPIYVDKKTHKSCTRHQYGMAHYKARSLEEHMMVLHLPLDPPTPDKIDVWMMGNIIYYILTDLYTFEIPENLNNHQVGLLLVEGKRSPYPEYIRHSRDPSHIAMKRALDMCWMQNWRERPSARDIADYMLGELRKITGEDDPDLRVVLPERDPNQSPDDEEYEAFND